MAAEASTSSLDELKILIRTCPVIDNHAHNLLRPHGQKTANLLTITSEASGDALEDTPTSLSHLRAIRQLLNLYDLPPDANWSAVKKRRAQWLHDDADGLIKRCFEGIQTILIDDGLSNGDAVEPYSWHDRFVRSRCKRIVRIETVATDILSSLYQRNELPVGLAVADEEACSIAWVTFVTAFEQAIAAAVEEPDIVGFKSVVCYRTGLNVHTGRDLDVTEDGLRSFRKHFLPECVARGFRIEAKGMNDALVISTCKIIAAGYRQNDFAKPLQFHTGLGDNDIHLLDSNPGCLQPLIKAYPTVPIVLLHSSYPYTREAGYLATVYKNCYLDIGEVFPMVSRDGQEEIFRQTLELTPWSKVLWSTDGHFMPESYWLANVQGREALEKVLCEYVRNEDLSITDAIQAVTDILFENANQLYDLRLKSPSSAKAVAEIPRDTTTKPAPEMATTAQAVMPTSLALRQNMDQFIPKPDNPYDILRGYEPFIKAFPETYFVFVQWLDFLGQMRSRCLPIAEFNKLVRQSERISISTGNLGTLQIDHMTPVCNPVGAICVEPDLNFSSLRPMQNRGLMPRAATVMSRFVDEEFKPLDLCPKSSLQNVVQKFEDEFSVELLVGFEIEITFCKRNPPESDEAFEPLDTTHAWGTFTDQQYLDSIPLMMLITAALREMGIDVQQMHSEAGPGQYEFVLAPLPPSQAVDTLIQARQAIMQIAADNKLRATCYPQPFPGVGTAAHAHISLNSKGSSQEELEKLDMPFAASLLEHLTALCAFTMPQAASYGRVVNDSWTCGTWIAWGTQNREVPLRKSGPLRWEIRCLDGCANMYLALAAVLAAGLLGLRNKTEMKLKDCPSNPTKLSQDEKEELGITTKLPTSLNQAIEAAEKDSELEKAMTTGIFKHYLVMKKAEQEMLHAMSEKDRKAWLMERY